MGEHATYRGESVKIGTCESMYYLRFDQRHDVQHERGNVDPNSDDVYSLRFRFPWPGEDDIEPGSGKFHDNGYERAVAVYGIKAPEGVEHYNVQFVAHAGYLLSLPCPEGTAACPTTADGKPVTIHRNGFGGAVQLVQQKYLRDGRLVPVCRCGGCGSLWRVEDPADIEALAVAFRSEADRLQRLHSVGPHGRDGSIDGQSIFYNEIADRILAGANMLAVAV